MGSPGASPPGAPPPADKSKAACKYMDDLTDLTTKFKTEVGCSAAAAGPPVTPALPAATTLTQAEIETWLQNKETANAFLKGATVAVDSSATGSFIITHVSDHAKTFTVTEKMDLDNEKDNIAAALDKIGTTMAGGRRGKRSARRGRGHKSSKGGRRSFKGGRRSRGCKGRKSRGRSNKSKGGAKMGKELKAWMKRQQKATGITPISKATIAATKTKPQANGSAQRSESSKHVAAQARGLNSSSS